MSSGQPACRLRHRQCVIYVADHNSHNRFTARGSDARTALFSSLAHWRYRMRAFALEPSNGEASALRSKRLNLRCNRSLRRRSELPVVNLISLPLLREASQLIIFLSDLEEPASGCVVLERLRFYSRRFRTASPMFGVGEWLLLLHAKDHAIFRSRKCDTCPT